MRYQGRCSTEPEPDSIARVIAVGLAFIVIGWAVSAIFFILAINIYCYLA